MKRKETVLVVHNYYQIPGGEDTVVANEQAMLEERGHKVIHYCRNNSELKSFSILKKLLLPLLSIFNPRTYRDIRRIIKDEKVELVHVHNTLTLISPAVYYAALSMNIPVIQTVHNFRLLCPGATFYRDEHICEECVDKGLGRAIQHKCYRNSAIQTLICVMSTWFHRRMGIYGKMNYICLTEFNKNKLLSIKQIRSEQVFVKPNFAQSQAEGIIPYSERKKQFAFVGRLDKLKGVDFLLKVWKQMGTAAPKLVICGTGPMQNWCENYIAENQLYMVEYKGFVQNEEAKKIIAQSQALILPTQWYEGFPMTIVEAYSVGTPVIGPRLGNVADVIEEGSTGYLYEPNDCDSLIHTFSKDFSLTDCIQQKFEERYSKNTNYELLQEIYSVVEETGGTVSK